MRTLKQRKRGDSRREQEKMREKCKWNRLEKMQFTMAKFVSALVLVSFLVSLIKLDPIHISFCTVLRHQLTLGSL